VGGPPVACRGAADAGELERQAAKLVATVVGMDVEVLAWSSSPTTATARAARSPTWPRGSTP
jgi:hypothetical protein